MNTDDTIKKAREILKNEGENMSDDDINTLLSVVDHLLEGWLDEFEAGRFGKTIENLTTVNN